jgi:DNA-binding response OmpR family regulator
VAKNTVKNDLSPTELRLMTKLSDGQLHTEGSLKLILDSEGSCTDDVVRVHISNMRKYLRPRGRDIINYRNDGYRMVRLLNTEE